MKKKISVDPRIHIKHQENFWGGIVFHPTDAIEDEWGQKILDELSKDKAARYVRIYSMFEDIVSMDGQGELHYDYTLSDARLDYLLDRGFTPMIAYGGIPAPIALNRYESDTNSYKKTRYKNKMWITSPPDIALWEEICREYTAHIVERYGEAEVKKWYIHCFNEPDNVGFFMKNATSHERCVEYCKMYDAFIRGTTAVCEDLKLGGPAFAFDYDFLEEFLAYIASTSQRMDYFSTHSYGTGPTKLQNGEKPLCVDDHIGNIRKQYELLSKYLPSGVEFVMDEWGACSHGFLQSDRFPELLFRETPKFSAYHADAVTRLILDENIPISRHMICLSGQHEMSSEFEGFRNFFSLNFIKKPIYNSYVLLGKLKSEVVSATSDAENLRVLATKDAQGEMAVLLTYKTKNFSSDVQDLDATISIEATKGKGEITVWTIDNNNTNPYGVFLERGYKQTLTAEQIEELRAEGTLAPRTFEAVADESGKINIDIRLTINGIMLIEIK